MEPDPRPSTERYGWLPAGLFGLVLAPLVVLGEAFTDCPGSGGCGGGFGLLRNLAILAGLCALIAWATNRMVAARRRQGRSAGAGVAGGCAFAVLVVPIVYLLLLAFR